jgi:hypothetical protein
MGANRSFFKKQGAFQPSGLNLEARAGSAGNYAGRIAGGAAQKDIGVAQALYRNSKFSPSKGTAASNAPGPKKV